MQTCSDKSNDATAASFNTTGQYTNVSVSIAPGVSGIMAIFGFTAFAYVLALNAHMPARTVDDDELTEPLYRGASADDK
jgi:hypothetical protein